MSDSCPTLGTSVLGDEELIRKAKSAENGRKFQLLYDHGWDSKVVCRVYDKRRHARLALVNHLIWWARHDIGQVRRLFSQSALCPGDLTQYRQYFRSLVRAAASLLGTECYDPSYSAANSETN